jgi:hypothetical protein
MRDHVPALAATLLGLALAGCPLNHSSTLSASSSGSMPSAASSSSSSSPSSGGADDEAAAPTSGIRGAIVRSQLETLNGLTPDQARVKLKQFGHDGNVTLGEVTDSGGGHTFVKACGVNKVCDTSGGSGISVHDDITLYLNPTLTIAPPP